jgi:probable HAF family extracellular repeat protein
MTKLISLIACLPIAFTAVANATVHAFIWDSTTGMTDLGSLGGDSRALGINDSGQVVGYSYLPDSTGHMVTWTRTGGIVDLGSIDNSGSSQGNAINSAGEIVGGGYDANLNYVAFLWSSSTGFVNLGEFYGADINDSDTITGVRTVFPAYEHGLVWRSSFSHPLFIGTLPGGFQSEGVGINNLGHITGRATLPNGEWDAIFWNKTDGMRDIGNVLQQSYPTTGFGINDHDEVVGSGGSPLRPFYWRGSTGMVLMRTLGGTNGEAFAINNSGAIAGDSQTPSGLYHATLWSGHNAFPQDLGTLPGGTTSSAKAINASGQVVGWSDIP